MLRSATGIGNRGPKSSPEHSDNDVAVLNTKRLINCSLGPLLVKPRESIRLPAKKIKVEPSFRGYAAIQILENLREFRSSSTSPGETMTTLNFFTSSMQSSSASTSVVARSGCAVQVVF